MNHDPRAGYEVRVAGHLDGTWTGRLGDVHLRYDVDGSTVITAIGADQTRLHGLLTALRDINAALLSVTPVPGGG